MNVPSVHQDFTDRQMFSVAYDLIAEVMQMKAYVPDDKLDLLDSPRIKQLIRKLDKWTNFKLDMEGGL